MPLQELIVGPEHIPGGVVDAESPVETLKRQEFRGRALPPSSVDNNEEYGTVADRV
jgi:hypothetical protein